MRDVCGEACFRKKEMFTNGLTMGLPPRTWAEKTVYGVKHSDSCVKRKDLRGVVSKKVMLIVLRKKFKFHRTNKWYMHNPAPVQENDTHKLLWDFDIHTDHLISVRRPDLIIIHKKKREFAKLSTLPSRLITE